jgi:hypothetical protein
VTGGGVSLQSVHTGKKKSGPSAIVIHLGAGVNPAAAQNVTAYSLTTVPRGKKAKGKPVALAQAIYDPATGNVSLIPRDKGALNQPLQLHIHTAVLNGSIQAASTGASSGDIVINIGK